MLDAFTWAAALVGVAEPEAVSVLEMVWVTFSGLPLSAADVPLDGGGVTDALAGVVEVESDELKLVAELAAVEDDARDDVWDDELA